MRFLPSDTQCTRQEDMTRLLNHGQSDAMLKGQQINSNLADQLMQLWRCFFYPQGVQHLRRRQLEVAPRFVLTGSVIPMGWCLPKCVSEQLQQVCCAHKADKARPGSQYKEYPHSQRH